MTIKKTIRVLFVLCLFGAGCGGDEAPSAPPRAGTQGQEPVLPDLAEALPPDHPSSPDFCHGFLRHGPFSADRENIDEVRSFVRLCDIVNDPFKADPAFRRIGAAEESECLVDNLAPNVAPGEGLAVGEGYQNCINRHRCPESDRSCVNVFRGVLLKGTLNSESFRDIFSPGSRDRDLQHDATFTITCSTARRVEGQCYE